MDKVIKDGVDVSECARFIEENHYCELGGTCDGSDDCYYKQLKRLQQENAELKAYKDVNEDFKTAWEELKAENEQLKEKIESYVCSQNCYAYKQADKYRTTLQEIKKIAEEWINNDWSCFHCRSNMDEKLKEILDLITKAEEE